MIEEMTSVLLKDYCAQKEQAIINLMHSEFLSVGGIKESCIWENVPSQNIEYLSFDGVRVWQIETITDGTKIFNRSKWI